MSAPTRFQTGVREPKNTEAIAFASIRAATGEHEAAPVYPPVDYLADLSYWQVLGNDKASDCVAVWWANQRRLTTHKLATEDYPDQEQVWALYKTQNPLFDPADPTSFGGPNDGGMEPQTLLEYLVREGGPDGVKALAFAKLDHTDLAEIQAAISALGSVLLIVSMTEAQQEQFQRQVPWDFDGTSPADGLHAVLIGGHKDKTADTPLLLPALTWGVETALTDAFFSNAVVQAWAVVYPEHLGSREFQDGIDVQALAAEYEQITGNPFPTDVQPAPTPDPQPSSAPDAPVITAPADGATVDTTQKVVGTGQAGCTVTLYDEHALLGSASVGSDNAWTISPDWSEPTGPIRQAARGETESDWTLTATQTDRGGQESAESDPISVTVRSVTPSPPDPTPGPTPYPGPAPDGDPDEVFARHLDYYLGDDPFNWDVQNDHRNRIREWLAARSDLVLPGSPRDRRRTQERVAAESAADAEARTDVGDLHLADQRAQAENERDGFPQHVPGEDRLEAAAERGRVMAEAAAEAQRDREQREAAAAAERAAEDEGHPVAGSE